MEVAAIREAIVALFSYIINDLCLKERRQNAINTVMLSCIQMPGFWEGNHVRRF